MKAPVHVRSKDKDPEHPSTPVTKSSKPKLHKPRAKREPKACTHDQKQASISPCLRFKKCSLPGSHVLWKLVGVSSFLTNDHVCLVPFFWLWAEVSSHPGQVVQPPQVTQQALNSLCQELVAPRPWAMKFQLGSSVPFLLPTALCYTSLLTGAIPLY